MTRVDSTMFIGTKVSADKTAFRDLASCGLNITSGTKQFSPRHHHQLYRLAQVTQSQKLPAPIIGTACGQSQARCDSLSVYSGKVKLDLEALNTEERLPEDKMPIGVNI